MKLLMFGTDMSVFAPLSPAAERMKEYGTIFDELHIVVYTNAMNAKQEMKLSENVFVYPTNTRHKLRFFSDAEMLAKKIIREREFDATRDAITAQDPFETGFVALKIGGEYKLPVQIQAHTDFLSPWFSRESFKNKFRARMGLRNIKKAVGIRVVSERIKRGLLHEGIPAEKTTVLPIIISQKETPHTARPSSPLRFLILSRLTREKNISLALKAFEELKKQGKLFSVIIVGDGPLKLDLIKEVRKRGLEEAVRFESWTENPASLFAAADLYLLTSNYEGYGRTVIEAACAGTPTLMTDVGLAGDILRDGENGFVIPVGDYRALTQKLEELIAAPEKIAAVQKNLGSLIAIIPSREEYLRAYKAAIENLHTTN